MNMPREIEVKSILNKNKRRDPCFLDDYTLNPYSACSFNCLYCYIRGSKYGEHMERTLTVKANAPELLRKQLSLRAKKSQFGFIVMSSATDPYLQAEAETGMTRRLLEIILEFRFPLHIITKSALVTRDLDLLQRINKAAILPPDLQHKLAGGCLVSFSFATLKDEVAHIFEPGATLPSQRLLTLTEVKNAGLYTGVSLMPLLPFISDTAEQLENAFMTFSSLKVDYLLPATLTLFGSGRSDSKTLVLKAVAKHFPELLPRYQQYFASSQGMPAYYKSAFEKKVAALHRKYQLKAGII